ncbi:MAG: hypothetical protein V3W34_06355 [Phycisphaerae bacterium]
MRTLTLQCTGAFCILWSAATAEAVVRSVSAEIVSEVSDQDGSSDQAIENVGETGLTPPISTRANLIGFGDADAVNGEAVALADFRDPTQGGPGRNPGEIGIEADCFSNDPSTRYELKSSVEETRVVSFDADDLGVLFGTQTVNSAVFVSGAMFLWSTVPGRDLTGLSAEVSFVVRRFDADENEEPVGDGQILLEETVSLNGGPNGSVTLDNDSALFVFAGDLTILPDDPEAAGLGEVDLGAAAVAQVAVLLEQNVSYSYEVVPGQVLILQAEFSITAANVPGGTGVAAVFGRELDEAVRILEIGLPEESAKSIVRRINRAIAVFTPEDNTPTTTSPLALPCGFLGFEMIPLGVLSLAMFVGRGARRRS